MALINFVLPFDIWAQSKKKSSKVHEKKNSVPVGAQNPTIIFIYPSFLPHP
jgi:hypothetical protein